MFVPVFGLLGLGLAWRRAATAIGFDPAGPEMFLGAVTLLFAFCLVAYLAKAIRRPATVAEDMRFLPGRGGLSTAILSVYLTAAILLPYSASLARAVLFSGLAVHVFFVALYLRTLLRAAPEQRRVSPIWHLAFVGFIVAPLSAVPLGHTTLSTVIFFATMPVAVGIFLLSVRQSLQMTVPPPLRPLLAIHLAPPALFATVGMSLGYGQVALLFCGLLLGLVTLSLVLARWITQGGFTPFWGALTFPATAACSACLAQGPEALRLTGFGLLLGATAMVPPIALRILRLWADGSLAIRTDAASA